MSESIKRSLGASTPVIDGASPFLTPDNVERIVRTLTQMRGAALKLGQMISIQDAGVFPREIEQVLQQVQNGANYMPRRQMRQVMAGELGQDWVSKFQEFDPVPFAAASIGQVHRAKLHDGRVVAVKVQYPGVADSIDSDLAHLKSIGVMAGFLPKGLFLENSMAVARRELLWETDYIREAHWMQRFGEKLKDHPVVDVPEPIMDLTTSKVLTMTFVPGSPLGTVADMDKATRNFVAEEILKLTLVELLDLGFMQTDPNWSNFLFDPETRRIKLLDFGSAREFDWGFLARYANVLEAAAKQDEAGVMKWSEELGFLTGYETDVMKQAHLQAVLTLGAPFTIPMYDFAQARQVTKQVRDLIPTMLEHRLTPPPDETYSLHRKVSGVFLLCARLGATLPCRELLWSSLEKFRERQAKGELPLPTPENAPKIEVMSK
ncbi:ABC1 family-domain-containing protein [Catenaria anguillulae PL171]|uniref:ABC1 family-domain-containing protein n=1 Tax=Catenaria anguillulae PL171 TaxID=765915 RepID=A0A1Y2HWR6_9FUNG|nr:ABC1 family-domain-containing protein [Catenaria anguillulae PL171]